MKISSGRINLRPLRKSDYKFIFNLVNSEGWIQNIGNGNINSLDDSKSYIDKILHNPKYKYFVIDNKESKISFGIITFLLKDKYKYPDLGFALLPQFEGAGFAYEACCLFLQKYKSLYSYKKILGITKVDNIKSISLLKKLKFIKNKRLSCRELDIYEIETKILNLNQKQGGVG